jgi:hypothetical protein
MYSLAMQSTRGRGRLAVGQVSGEFADSRQTLSLLRPCAAGMRAAFVAALLASLLASLVSAQGSSSSTSAAIAASTSRPVSATSTPGLENASVRAAASSAQPSIRSRQVIPLRSPVTGQSLAAVALRSSQDAARSASFVSAVQNASVTPTARSDARRQDASGYLLGLALSSLGALAGARLVL